MDGKRAKWKKKESIQWVIDQMDKSVVQEVKPEGSANVNYDKNLGDKHLVWCGKCGYVYDEVYGELYPNFPKYGKEQKNHEEKCERQFTRRN
tara:strand:+ start:7217 stop:7492 length:276 start_codon:yes stop_codon:yes gene_type:complete